MTTEDIRELPASYNVFDEIDDAFENVAPYSTIIYIKSLVLHSMKTQHINSYNKGYEEGVKSTQGLITVDKILQIIARHINDYDYETHIDEDGIAKEIYELLQKEETSQ